MLRFTARAAVAALSLAAAALRADTTPPTPAAVPPTAATDYGPAFTLSASVEEALAKNFTVRIQHFPILQAMAQQDIAKSQYLPTFNFAANKVVSQAPQSTSILNNAVIASAGPYSNVQTTDANVSDTLITGATVTADYNVVRTFTNSEYSLLNPLYAGAATLSVTQPVLQGAGTDYAKANLKIAALGTTIANQNFKSAVLTVIYNVETAYFNLVYAREQYKVAQDTLKLAQQLYDENTVKRRTGVVTDLDVLQAKVGVATAQTALIQDQQLVQNSEDALLQYMGQRDFSTAVGSVEFPEGLETAFSFDRSYKLARDNGPNLAAVSATIEQYKLQALQAKRNNLPRLDLIGSAGYVSTTNSDYSAATNRLWSGDGYGWTAGVQFSMPWGLKANKARYRQAMASVESEQVAYDQADQMLVVQVRAAVRAVNTNVEALKAATQQADLAAQQYDLQKAKFDAGLATSYDVLQAQDQLETSRQAELQAKVNLRVAVADVRFLEGTSLDFYHVKLPE